jgi:hypothetical protein
LHAQVFVFLRRLLVVSKLAERNDAFLDGEVRQHLEHRLGQRFVVSFLGIEANAAIMADAALPGAKFLKPQDGGEIIDIAAEASPRLAQPEGRFNHRDHAGPRHCLVIVGSARNHVRMRVNEHRARCGRQDAPLGILLQARCVIGLI